MTAVAGIVCIACERCWEDVCRVSLISCLALVLQLQILTNEYIVLPAATNYLLHSAAPGYQQSNAFTATIGVLASHILS